MFRISGVILPPNKHIFVALMSIYGIGKTRAIYICKELNISPYIKVSDLNDILLSNIQKKVEDFEIEGNLRRRIAVNIKRLKDIKCYRGNRHKLHLPVNGQRTRTNARTRKRNKIKKK